MASTSLQGFNSNQLNPMEDLWKSLSAYQIPNMDVASLGSGAIPTGSVAGAFQDPGMFAGIGDWFKDSGIFNQYNDKGAMTGQGWGGTALGAAQALTGAYMGMKQYGLAKKSLNEGMRQFNLNYDAQRQTTNSALQDRQSARVASNPGAYQSVDEYMKQNGIRNG